LKECFEKEVRRREKEKERKKCYARAISKSPGEHAREWCVGFVRYVEGEPRQE